MTWKTIQADCGPPAQAEQGAQLHDQVKPNPGYVRPHDPDPGHVRALAHYTPMLRDLKRQK